MIRRRPPSYRLLGKIYMVLMLGIPRLTLFMPAMVGPMLFGHFGFIHPFSLLTAYSVPSAYFAARRHDHFHSTNSSALLGFWPGWLGANPTEFVTQLHRVPGRWWASRKSPAVHHAAAQA